MDAVSSELSVGELAEAVVRHELVVHYQPQVETASGDVVGIEALVRWNHAERGLVAPIEFIDLAERTGLIEPLTDYVLETALAFGQRLAHEGHVLTVAVNLAAPSLLDERLPERVSSALAITDAPPSRLQLEITETSLMESPELALETLGHLRSLGVSLSLDDFGTGYSSLARLHLMPINQVKIDRSFVTAIRNDGDTGVLSLIVDLGRQLGHEIVAEGAETSADVTALAGMGCHLVQGYHFSRPLPADDLLAWLDRRRDSRLQETLVSCAVSPLPGAGADRPRRGADSPSMETRLHVALEAPLVESRDLKTTARAALRVLAEELGCGFGAWWRVNRDGRLMVCETTWQIDGDGIMAHASRELGLARGVGLPGRAWGENEVLTTGELRPDSEHPRCREAALSGVRGAVAIPLRSSGEVIGVLELLAGEVLDLDEHALHALWTVGGRVGQHLRRQEAECRANESTDALARLARLSRALATQSGDSARSEICAAIRDIAGADIVLEWEPDAGHTELRVRASVGFDGGPLRTPLIGERSGAATAFASGVPTFVGDVNDHALPSPRLARAVGVTSSLYLPVTRAGHSVGAFTVAWKQRAAQPRPGVMSALAVAADQMALILPPAPLQSTEPTFQASVSSQPARRARRARSSVAVG